MTDFFHAYDLRGKYPDQISEKEAEEIGKAYGTYTDAETVLIGRDGRKHAKKITKAFSRGIKSTGTNVLNAGLVPTPVVYFGMIEKNIKSSAVVTASHNPSEYTGFKFTKENGLAMSREGGMKQIQEIYEQKNFEMGKGEEKSIELIEEYIMFVKSKVTLEKSLNVVVNYGNGSAAVLGKQLLEEIGCNVTEINQELNGDFPNHLPAPGNQKAQKQTIEAMKDDTDLGIIFDGDGDRAGFIDAQKNYIGEDNLIALFAEEILQKTKKGKVIHDLRASKLVPEIIKKNKGKPMETRVGHTFISEKIHHDTSIVFAGELSGHFYFPAKNVPWDDGLFAAAYMCQIVSETNLVKKIESMPEYPVSPELRIDCAHHAKNKVVETITEKYSNKKQTTVDGVKIYFDKGWALVRPSNTEEKMSVRIEADTEKDLNQIRANVEKTVRNSIERFT